MDQGIAQHVALEFDDHRPDELLVAEGFDGLDDVRRAVDVPVTEVADPATQG
jgi:hypothetical protein